MSQTKKKRRRVNICQKIIQTTPCLGKYYLYYEDNAPVFICDKCGQKELTWKKFYDEYLHLWKTKENWDKEKDKISCILGFFCHMYRERYNTEYIFVPTSFNPYSSKECKDTRTLLVTFNGNAHEVRKYVYWLFKKCINKSTTITSLGYLVTPNIIRKYNLQIISKNILHRESKLPKNFVEWCKTNTPEIFDKYAFETMNDLGAFYSYYKVYATIENNSEAIVIKEAERLGLIKDNKLNIG